MNQQIFTRTTFRLSLSCATVLGGSFFLRAGCGKDDPVRVYDVQPKDPGNGAANRSGRCGRRLTD